MRLRAPLLLIVLGTGCSFGSSRLGDSPDGPGASTDGEDEDSGDAEGDGDDGSTIPDAGPWVPEGPRRRALTLSNAEGLGGAPLLLTLDPSRIEYEDTMPNGADVSVTTPDGTPLPIEIERWVPGDLSHVWVGLPAEPPAMLYLVYATGEPGPDPDGSVWDERFAAVWHFADDAGSSSLTDATGQGYAASPPGAWQIDDGLAGTGAVTDGTPIVVDMPPTLEDAMTIEGWIRRDANDPTARRDLVRRSNTYALRVEGQMEASPRLRVWRDEGSVNAGPSQSLPTGDWAYLAATYDDGDIRVYIDGELSAAESFEPGTIAVTDAPFEIGDGLAADLDEIRVSTTARSADWIAGQYRSMTDEALAFGDPEPLP